MQSLYECLPYSVKYKGKVYKIKPYFDNVLQVFSIYQDKVFTDIQKLDIACGLLLVSRKKLNKSDKVGLINLIFDTIISSKKNAADNIKSFDFLQDGQYIYASFVYDYGIDLFQQQGKLHWWKFIALFNSLSESSKMSQIISIRLRPLPEPDKYNGKEIESLMKAKQFYALEFTQEEREKQLVNGLYKLRNTLLSLANK